MDGHDVGGLYLHLGLDTSGLRYGFEDANKIVAENMAQLQSDLRNAFRQILLTDQNLHAAGHFTEEDLARLDAEQKKRAFEVPIRLDDNEIKELDGRLRDAERISKQAKTAEINAAVNRYKANGLIYDSKIYKNQQMRDLKLNDLDAVYSKLEDKLETTVHEEIRAAIEKQMSAIESLQIAIDDEAASKTALIDQERADKLAEIRDRIASADRTAFENRLADIEKEKQSWIQAGMDKLEADELAQKKREQLEQETADKVAEIRKSINAEFQTDLQNQIDKIQEEQQAWVEMGVSASEAAELAGQKMEQAFEKAVDKAKNLNQSLEDNIFAQEHSQYENDLRKLQQEVVQKAQEYQKAGLFDDNARALLNRYYNNSMRELQQRAAKSEDYTKSPTDANSGFQLIDYGQQQQIIGLFTKENTARQSVINSLTAEQRERLSANESLRKIIEAQNSFVDSTEQAAENLQDASSIEIIHGDQMGVSEHTGEAPSFDELLTNELQKLGTALPTEEFQALESQTQKVVAAESDFGAATENSTEVTKKSAASTKTFSDEMGTAREAVKTFAESMKNSGLRKTDTDDSKTPTKSSLNGEIEPPREKVQLKTSPKDKQFLKVSDLGFDYDTAKDIFLTGAGIAAASAGTGVGVAFSPEIIAAAVVTALGGGVIKGTYDNREERLSATEKFSASVDLSEIVSPLSSIDETAKSILSELQDRNSEQATDEETDESTILADISGKVQGVWDELQASNPAEAETSNASVLENLRETLSPVLTNINTPLSEMLSAINDRQVEMPTIAFPTEVIVQPLNTISGLVERIFGALSTREPPKVEVSPSMNIDLGGAYVFDEALKRELVEDITSNIVTRITEFVQRATASSSGSFGFGG